jgi:predicted secreted hydrolase
MHRRQWLLGTGLAVAGTASTWATTSAPPSHADSRISPERTLRFPRDFGSHPGARTEWWYVTGWLADGALGFQITFFRSRTEVEASHPSRFAATQLLFAHAAITDLRDPQRPRLRHDERISRAGFGVAEAALDDTRLRLADWTMRRESGPDASAHSTYRIAATSDAAAFGYDLSLASTQPVLLQGDAGFSRKGPLVEQASHYYSQPQLAVRGSVRLDQQRLPVTGTAWMDHEWSDTLLADDAVGWDWIGMNLFDGRSLTAFQLRRADGSALWAGGSTRAGGPLAGTTGTRPPGIPAEQGRSFGADEVRFRAGRLWQSAASRATYPVEWAVDTPAGRFTVKARLDGQELDSRGSTGAIYWEGLSDLYDAAGRLIGRGYLEMTGYAARLRL